jgi:alpha-tubulin suppressor-like RCC1 family protein
VFQLVASWRVRVLPALVTLVVCGCTRPKPDEVIAPARIEPCAENELDCETEPGRGGAGPFALGTPDCETGADCGSGFCLLDAENTPRCCEQECLESGRVCSTAGQCVCSGLHRDVGGVCLLVDGQPCGAPDDCVSNQCADGVCCNAACDGICEHCNAPPEVGTCALYERDPACISQTNFECVAQNRCRLPMTEPALACRADADCDSDHCEPALSEQPICCATECSGICQRCDATTGTCSFPPSDPACSLVTSCLPNETCLEYVLPLPRACSASGQCAECERIPARAGVACDIGAQCDGSGACTSTGLGLVAAGTYHTCAVRSGGNVRCWGNNTSGQLGAAFERLYVGDDEAPADVGEALELDFGRTVVQVVAALSHTCVLFKEAGAVRCWGRRENIVGFGAVPGLLGTSEVDVDDTGFVLPLTTEDVALPEPAVQISAANGGAHTCAVLKSGKVACWGSNNHGQCGIGESSDNVGGLTNEPLPVVNLDPNDPNARALQVSAGAEHTCALLAEGGRVTCWGAGGAGQLGYGEDDDRRAPRGDVAIGEPALQIVAGTVHTCALLERGRVRCWGTNGNGQLGYGHAIDIGDDETPAEALTIPRPAPSTLFLGGDARIGGGNVLQISSIADTSAVCARYASGAVRCWGANHNGQLGYGHTEDEAPRRPPDDLDFRTTDLGKPVGGDVQLGGFAVALSDGGRCALVRPDAAPSSAPLALYCWGTNSDGQLGLPRAFTIPGESSAERTPLEMGPVSWE